MTHDLKQIPLQDLMNRMASRMEALAGNQSGAFANAPEELRFWLAADPLLADLYKQYLDAKASHQNLARLRGDHDPMVDVARDMEDSTKSAFETRLIELRRDEETKSIVLDLARRAHAEEEERLSEKARAESAKFWRAFSQSKARMLKNRQKSTDHFLLIMIGLIALQDAIDGARHTLSIASTFGGAANDRDLKKRSAV